MYARSGLSEYPGYYCYDANRPSWLPNWFDTLGEEMCKFKAIPGNITTCLNPLSTNCSPDSLINLNVKSNTPNTDPTLSGPGMMPEGTPEDQTNAPKTPAPDFMPVVLLVGAVALLSFLKG